VRFSRAFIATMFVAVSIASCIGTATGQNPLSTTRKGATSTASKGAKQTPKQTKTPTISLPSAHSGQPYGAFVPLPPPQFYGPPVFQLDPAPTWLHYESSTSTFHGVPDDTSTGIYQNITLRVGPQPGLPGNVQTYIFTLAVFVGAETVIVPNGPKIAPLASKIASGKGTVVVQDTSLNPSQIPSPSAQLTAGLNTASTVIVGKVDPKTLPVPAVAAPGATGAQSGTPTNYPLLAVELKDLVSGTTSLISFPQPGAKPPSSQTTTTLPINEDGTFSFPLSGPLTPKTQVRLIAVAPSGYSFAPATTPDPKLDPIGERLALGTQSVVQAEIPLPKANLAETLSAGQSVLTGSVAQETLPVSPTAAATADPKAGTLASPGNLPLLAVEVADPLTKLVIRAPLMVPGAPGATSTQIQINPDGTFTLPLKTPLVSGQTIRIIAIPPQGYAFSRLPDATICDFGTERGLRKVPSLVAADECVVLPDSDRPRLAVYTTLTLSAPVVSSKLGLNATTVNGLATPSTTGASGTTVLIGVERFPLGDPCRGTEPKHILTSDNLEPTEPCRHDTSKKPQLADLTIAASGSASATTSKTVQTQANGSFSLTLAEPLAEEERFRIVQILPPGTVFPDKKQALGAAFSQPITVPSVADWGRVHADFAAGLLTSNNSQIGSTDSGTFTQAHQFVDLTVEKGWLLPGCYLQSTGACLRRRYQDTEDGKKPELTYYPDPDESWWERHHPGIATYFEGRLTAIPVTTVGSSTTTTGTTSSASTLLTSNFLTTAETARFGVGFYMPTLLQRWDWHGAPYALFIAPLAKVGFNSVTGATAINVPAGTPGASATGTVTLEPLYNLWGYGGRIGHFQLSRSDNKSPETESYIDVIYGPYSNLQSYICQQTPADKILVITTSGTPPTTTTSTTFVNANGYPGITGYAGSSCASDYPSYYAAPVPSGLTFSIPANTSTVTYTDLKTYSYQPYDSRKRIYRLDIEGLLKIPMTPLYLGFNANLGQKTFLAKKLDSGYAAPDDLEIFFGTKFDIGELFAKLGINPF
jgi:hypothetical protein